MNLMIIIITSAVIKKKFFFLYNKILHNKDLLDNNKYIIHIYCIYL